MQLVKTKVYHGPNRWSSLPVLEAHIEFPLADSQLPFLLGQLVSRLHATAGVETNPIAPVGIDSSTIFMIPFECEEEELLRDCIETAIRYFKEAIQMHGKLVSIDSIDTTSEHRRLVDLADTVRLGPSSRAIVRAAAARSIPCHRLNHGSLVQFGEGVYQRRTWTAETDATSAIAESIASDKQLTRSMLAAVGVNVPKGRLVSDREDAWKAAQEFGFPVVVKPRNANHACGVSLDLSKREAILAAYDWACDDGSTTDVIVEQYIQGDHHRLLVVGEKMVAAAKGQREYVAGDGIRTVRMLVDELNRDPRRGENYTDQLGVVKLDDAALIELRKQGLDFDSIPAKEQQVLVRHVGELIEDCTARVHPITSAIAVLAAQTIGLDIAGMDVVARDISRPLSEQRGCIIEVNAGPSLAPHVQPVFGEPQPVGDAVVELLFPNQSSATILTILTFDSRSAGEMAREVASNLSRRDLKVGIASNQRLVKTNETWPVIQSIGEYRSLLLHPWIEAIVIDETLENVAENGVACTHANLVVIPVDWFLIPDDPTVRATLMTIRHLLAQQGNALVYGDPRQEMHVIASQLGIPASRIRIVADTSNLLSFV